jgi:trk system potassium uptake protein TrkA
MRTVFIGATSLSVATAEALIRNGHEVVIIERDKARIESLSEYMDCGFVNGDGTKPAILREVDPERSDALLCLTNSDQDNILASLVGRSIGFKRVITKVEDAEYQHICTELGLSDTVVPDESVARMLLDMLAGHESVELTAFVKGGARFFPFIVREAEAGAVEDLDLPRQTRLVCVYRDNSFFLPEETSRLKERDEVLLITHEERLDELRERWGRPPQA